MKKRTIALWGSALAICVFTGGLGWNQTTTVAETADVLAYLKERNILTGYENGDFGLEQTITRAEFTTVLMRAVPSKPSNDTVKLKFSDLPQEHWAYADIMAATDLQIVNGFENATFAPEESVLYEDAVKMVLCAFENSYAEYPVGFLTAAMEGGYLDDVSGKIGQPITRDGASHLIYNALILSKQKLEDEKRLASYEDMWMSSSGGGNGGGVGAAWSTAPMAPTGTVSMESVIPEAAEPDIFTANYDAPYHNTEEYTAKEENIFKDCMKNPLSTFSIDVDTASYSNMRRFLMQGQIPPKGSVRTEELLNYFDYDLPQPEGNIPFSVTTEVAECPWNPKHQLAMIGIQGNDLSESERQPSNIVFLIDTSGSMYDSDKLPLVQKSMALLLDQLDERDTISMVAYAGSAGVILEPTSASEKEEILTALYSLRAGGSTAGADGIELAYQLAEQNKTGGNNRIILCTDGDFNVGVSSTGDLESLIQKKKESGIYLSVLGFGMDNYKDNRMETLADCGNGNYAYIDNLKEAKKVLMDDMVGTLYTIAKDVKLQVEFNPSAVAQYRLIGYENRVLQTEDFDNDAKDAGELGAGHAVIALYEIVPATGEASENGLRYQHSVSKQDGSELMYVKLRYKRPDSDSSELLEYAVANQTVVQMSNNLCFASAIAELGMLLNESDYKGDIDFDSVMKLAERGRGTDTSGLRGEFIQLTDLAKYIFKTKN